MNRYNDRNLRAVRSTIKSGKSVAEAVRAAAEALGVAEDQLEVTVLDEGSRGILGIGAREAKVAAKVRAEAPRGGPRGRGPAEGSRDRRGPQGDDRGGEGRERSQGDGRDGRARRGGGVKDARQSGKDGGPDQPRAEARGGGRGEASGDATRGRHGDRSRGDRSQGGRSDSRRGGHQGGRGRSGGGGGGGRGASSPAQPRESAASMEPRVGGYEADVQRISAGLIQRLGIQATVSVTFEDEAYSVVIDAHDDDALLIGKSGETLDAVQHLLLKMVGRVQEGAQVRVDVAGYRERRDDELAIQARDIAKQVAQTQRSQTIGPMKASERRIVHRAVAEVEGVTTKALGDGALKRIVIGLASEIENLAAEDSAPAPRRGSTYGRDEERPVGADADEAPFRPARSHSDGPRRSAPPMQEPVAARAEAPPAAAEEWGRRPKPAKGRRR